MTFTFMDLVVIASLWVSALGLAFGIVKFFNAQTHARITREVARLDASMKDLKQEHSEKVDGILTQIKEMIKDLKEEVHRATGRLDEFYKTIIEMNKGS